MRRVEYGAALFLGSNSLVRPPPEPILPSRPLDPSAVARSGCQGWAAKGGPLEELGLDSGEHDGRLLWHGARNHTTLLSLTPIDFNTICRRIIIITNTLLFSALAFRILRLGSSELRCAPHIRALRTFSAGARQRSILGGRCRLVLARANALISRPQTNPDSSTR